MRACKFGCNSEGVMIPYSIAYARFLATLQLQQHRDPVCSDVHLAWGEGHVDVFRSTDQQYLRLDT